VPGRFLFSHFPLVEPASGVDTEWVDSLKALDPQWPISEADIEIEERCRDGVCPNLASYLRGLEQTDEALIADVRSAKSPNWLFKDDRQRIHIHAFSFQRARMIGTSYPTTHAT
jgi:hypothetical protein